jgi:hypothetical protein
MLAQECGRGCRNGGGGGFSPSVSVRLADGRTGAVDGHLERDSGCAAASLAPVLPETSEIDYL